MNPNQQSTLLSTDHRFVQEDRLFFFILTFNFHFSAPLEVPACFPMYFSPVTLFSRKKLEDSLRMVGVKHERS